VVVLHCVEQLVLTHVLKASAAELQPDWLSWVAHAWIVAESVVGVPPGQMHER
jgi:hypothetical protein